MPLLCDPDEVLMHIAVSHCSTMTSLRQQSQCGVTETCFHLRLLSLCARRECWCMNVQELVDKNRAASFPVGIPDASSGLQGTIAQPVTGPSLNQFSAITAALQALQASMTTMLPQSESAQENEPSVDNQATDSSAD